MLWIAVGLIQRWTINNPASAFSELVDSPLLAESSHPTFKLTKRNSNLAASPGAATGRKSPRHALWVSSERSEFKGQ